MNTIPQSKRTIKLREAAAALLKERAKLADEAQGILADDAGTTDAAGARLANTRAKSDVVTARLSRVRQELMAAVVADVVGNCEAAGAAREEARKALNTARVQWREAVEQAHPRAAAQKIISDSSLLPHGVRDAKTKYDEACSFLADAETTRAQVDKLWRERYADSVAEPGPGALPKRCPPDWYLANAGRLCAPELAD